MVMRPLPTDKRLWSPSLIPGPIMLVSTVDDEGRPNVAPKSWVQMVAFDPPTLMFAGSNGQPTEDNALRTGCFALNVVDETLLPSVLRCLQWRGEERIERSGWSLVDASRIRAPVLDGAPAHLECELRGSREIGSGLVVFGEIVAATVDERILEAEEGERYQRLAQALFLEDGVYSIVQRMRRAD